MTNIPFQITLTSTLKGDCTAYAVSPEALTSLAFAEGEPLPTLEVQERFAGVDKTFSTIYTASNEAPDQDEIEAGVVWALVGEANGQPIYLTLGSAMSLEDEVEEEA